MSPRWLLTVEDPVELMVIEAVVNKALEIQEQRDRNLAILIGNELASRLG